MTDEELETIRAFGSADDIPTLLAEVKRQAALLARCRRVLRSTRSVLGQPHRAADVDAWWGIQEFARGRVRDLLKALGDDDD